MRKYDRIATAYGMQDAPLTITAAARQLGLSESGTRRLDGELMPTRTSTGMRLYDPRLVAAVAGHRAACKAVRP